MDDGDRLDLCVEVAERSGLNLRMLLETVRGLDHASAVIVLSNLEAMPRERLPRVGDVVLFPRHAQSQRQGGVATKV